MFNFNCCNPCRRCCRPRFIRCCRPKVDCCRGELGNHHRFREEFVIREEFTEDFRVFEERESEGLRELRF